MKRSHASAYMVATYVATLYAWRIAEVPPYSPDTSTAPPDAVPPSLLGLVTRFAVPRGESQRDGCHAGEVFPGVPEVHALAVVSKPARALREAKVRGHQRDQGRVLHRRSERGPIARKPCS